VECPRHLTKRAGWQLDFFLQIQFSIFQVLPYCIAQKPLVYCNQLFYVITLLVPAVCLWQLFYRQFFAHHFPQKFCSDEVCLCQPIDFSVCSRIYQFRQHHFKKYFPTVVISLMLSSQPRIQRRPRLNQIQQMPIFSKSIDHWKYQLTN
jgi:hypothetical protein